MDYLSNISLALPIINRNNVTDLFGIDLRHLLFLRVNHFSFIDMEHELYFGS